MLVKKKGRGNKIKGIVLEVVRNISHPIYTNKKRLRQTATFQIQV